MTIESASFISGLNASNPGSSDAKSEGDDHLRLLKSTIKATFPNITGAVTLTHTQINSAVIPDGSGNVGVGITPTAGLHVSKDSGTYIAKFERPAISNNRLSFYNSAGLFYQDLEGGSNAMVWALAGVEKMRLAADGTVTIPGTLAASIPWSSVTGKPTNVSAFTNDAGYLTSAGTVTWGAVTGKPTAVSYFSNDAGYQTTSGTVANLSGGSVSATTIAASGNITTLGAFTASGLVYGRAGGSGLGRITTTTTPGSPAGTSQGDLVLVY